MSQITADLQAFRRAEAANFETRMLVVLVPFEGVLLAEYSRTLLVLLSWRHAPKVGRGFDEFDAHFGFAHEAGAERRHTRQQFIARFQIYDDHQLIGLNFHSQQHQPSVRVHDQRVRSFGYAVLVDGLRAHLNRYARLQPLTSAPPLGLRIGRGSDCHTTTIPIILTVSTYSNGQCYQKGAGRRRHSNPRELSRRGAKSSRNEEHGIAQFPGVKDRIFHFLRNIHANIRG